MEKSGERGEPDVCSDQEEVTDEKRIPNPSKDVDPNKIFKKIVSNWMNLTPKRHMRKTLKIYEEQQLQEIPGASEKQGTVMHAALTSEIDNEDYRVDGKLMEIGMRVRNHALIHYIAKLAVSNHDNDTFDFSFVQSLLKNGADINAMDKYGQTVFHEVARSWHPDVAQFLLQNGANINQQDKFGRAPLHVSAAVDYVEMVEFLVSRGAKVNIQTDGSLQTPIHFAAKNDACRSLKALIAYGVDVNCRDYQERTPLQLAAAMSRTKAARLLIEMGVPAGVYDKDGEMALSLLVIKMPDVAKIALDQLMVEDKINHKKYFFLNYLEGARVVDGRAAARTPMEAAVVSESVKVIMHPVMQRLIVTKWEKFGRRWAWFDFFINMLSAIIWTIMGVTLPLDSSKLYYPHSKTWWRIALAIIALLLTLHEIVRQVVTTVRTKKSLTRWKNYRESSLSKDMPFCHPQWPDEKRFVDNEIKNVREYRWLASHDRWIYVDWATLILIIAASASHVVFFTKGTQETRQIHVRFMCLLLIVIWVRILKFVRPFQGTGAFVASFTKLLGDIFLALFLVALIFLPYASSFWIAFGGLSPNPAKGYGKFSNILYQVFQMTVLDTNHNVLPFLNIDPFMARILSCTYIFISYVIVLNLIIAMITDTFKRVFNYAIEHAAIEKAKTILNIEESMRTKSRSDYWGYICLHCSPFVIDRLSRPSESVVRENTGDILKETHAIVEHRLGKQFGDGKASSIEEILKLSKEIYSNYMKSKEMLLDVFQKLRNMENITAEMEAKAAQSTQTSSSEKAKSPTTVSQAIRGVRRTINKKMKKNATSRPASTNTLRSNAKLSRQFSEEATLPKNKKSSRKTKNVSKSLGHLSEQLRDPDFQSDTARFFPKSRRRSAKKDCDREKESEILVSRPRAKTFGYNSEDEERAAERKEKIKRLQRQNSERIYDRKKSRRMTREELHVNKLDREESGDSTEINDERDYELVGVESDDVSLLEYLQNSSPSNC